MTWFSYVLFLRNLRSGEDPRPPVSSLDGSIRPVTLPILAVETIGGRLGSEGSEVSGWFMPNVLPTLSLMVSLIRAEALKPAAEDPVVRPLFASFSVWGSAAYLGARFSHYPGGSTHRVSTAGAVEAFEPVARAVARLGCLRDRSIVLFRAPAQRHGRSSSPAVPPRKCGFCLRECRITGPPLSASKGLPRHKGNPADRKAPRVTNSSKAVMKMTDVALTLSLSFCSNSKPLMPRQPPTNGSVSRPLTDPLLRSLRCIPSC